MCADSGVASVTEGSHVGITKSCVFVSCELHGTQPEASHALAGDERLTIWMVMLVWEGLLLSTHMHMRATNIANSFAPMSVLFTMVVTICMRTVVSSTEL